MEYLIGQGKLSGPKESISGSDFTLIDYPDLLEAIGELSFDKKRSSTNQSIAAIKSLFRYLFSLKFIPMDTGALIKSKKLEISDSVDAFTEAEVERLLHFVRYGFIEVEGVRISFPSKRAELMWQKSKRRDYALFKAFLTMGSVLKSLSSSMSSAAVKSPI